MRKTFIVAMLAIFLSANAQDTLNYNASFIKENIPALYSQIRTMAAVMYFNDWPTMVQEINSQADNFDSLVFTMYHDATYDSVIMNSVLKRFTFLESDNSVYAVNYSAAYEEYKLQVYMKKTGKSLR